MQLNQGFELEI